MTSCSGSRETAGGFLTPKLNKIIYALFFLYSVYFLATYGTTMNSDGVYNSMRILTRDKQPWMIMSYCASFMYIVWAALNFFYGKRAENPSVLSIILTAFALRLVPAMIIYGANPDMRNFVLSQQAAAEGHWETAIGRMPYLPFFSYILLLMHKINIFFQLPEYFVIKLTPILFDSALAAALFYITRDRNKAMHYAWNPVTILIFAGHGQFDSITLFFIAAALYTYGKSPGTTGPGLLYGAAFQSKWWPFILLPVFLIRMKPVKSAIFLASWSLVLFAFSAFYLKYDPGLLLIPFKYSGIARDYGISGLVYYIIIKLLHGGPEVYAAALMFIKVICGVAIILAVILSRKSCIIKSSFFVILTFYILCPGWSIQYFSWLALFMFLSNMENRPFFKYAFLMIFTIYFTVVLYDLPAFFGFSQVDLRNAFAIISFILAVSAVPLWINHYKAIKSGE